jgi:hypothetical protein
MSFKVDGFVGVRESNPPVEFVSVKPERPTGDASIDSYVCMGLCHHRAVTTELGAKKVAQVSPENDGRRLPTATCDRFNQAPIPSTACEYPGSAFRPHSYQAAQLKQVVPRSSHSVIKRKPNREPQVFAFTFSTPLARSSGGITDSRHSRAASTIEARTASGRALTLSSRSKAIRARVFSRSVRPRLSQCGPAFFRIVPPPWPAAWLSPPRGRAAAHW